MQGYSFMPYMAVIALCWTFLYFRAPETKGRSVIELTAYFKAQHSIATLPAGERKHYRTFTST